MNFEVYKYHIIGESENGLSAGQLTTDQIWEYLDDCTDWSDPLVFPLFHELCDRLNMDFDAYDTYDDLYNESFNKIQDLIEQAAKEDFEKQDLEKGPFMSMTVDKALDRLLEHRKENKGILLLPDEYINAWNNLLIKYIMDDNLNLKPVRWCE